MTCMNRRGPREARAPSRGASGRKNPAARNSKARIGPAKIPANSPFRIDFAVRQRLLAVDRKVLARLARTVLERERVAAARISVAVVDDPQIHAINRDFLGHDFPTDVVSFLLECTPQRSSPRATARLTRRGAGKALEGEIVISAETALKNAARYAVTPGQELALYLVHGLLHLCGYDDLTPREKRLMRRREAEALQAMQRPAAASLGRP